MDKWFKFLKEARDGRPRWEKVAATPAPGGGIGPALEEEVEPESFNVHNDLERRIWDNMKMKDEVRLPLLKIAKSFIDKLKF